MNGESFTGVLQNIYSLDNRTASEIFFPALIFDGKMREAVSDDFCNFSKLATPPSRPLHAAICQMCGSDKVSIISTSRWSSTVLVCTTDWNTKNIPGESAHSFHAFYWSVTSCFLGQRLFFIILLCWLVLLFILTMNAFTFQSIWKTSRTNLLSSRIIWG